MQEAGEDIVANAREMEPEVVIRRGLPIWMCGCNLSTKWYKSSRLIFGRWSDSQVTMIDQRRHECVIPENLLHGLCDYLATDLAAKSYKPNQKTSYLLKAAIVRLIQAFDKQAGQMCLSQETATMVKQHS